MSKTLCPLPWIHYATRNNGSLRVCCHANVSSSQGTLRDSEGQLLSTSNSQINDSRNSQTLKDIRTTMLKGEWPKDCSRCQKEESNQLTSRRQMETDKWTSLFNPQKAREWTQDDGSIDVDTVPLVSYDLRFGNVCNLRCRMCGPTDSNSWYSDYVKVNHRTFFDDTHGRVHLDSSKTNQDAYNWHNRIEFWQDMEKHIANIEYLYLVGGEPLLIPNHIDFLEYCVSSGHASHIELEYNTNLTALPDKVLQLWPHFKLVKVGVSLDGIHEVNEYIRYPSVFHKVIHNVRTIENLKAQNIRLWLAPTVQIFNIFHLPRMIDWVFAENFEFLKTRGKKRALAFHILHNPSFYSIQTLPLDLKEIAREQLQSYIRTKNVPVQYEDLWLGTVKNLNAIIDFMMAKDQSEQFELFLRETTALDVIRKQSYLTICPELALYKKGACPETGAQRVPTL